MQEETFGFIPLPPRRPGGGTRTSRPRPRQTRRRLRRRRRRWKMFMGILLRFRWVSRPRFRVGIRRFLRCIVRLRLLRFLVRRHSRLRRPLNLQVLYCNCVFMYIFCLFFFLR